MNPQPLTLAIDQGTHSTRAVIYDDRGQAVALERRPVALQRHSNREVEQSPQEILASMQDVMDAILGDPAIDPDRIQAAGLATQRSSVLAWDVRNGRALSAVLSWQDTRTAAQLAQYESHAAEIRQRTGLPLSPHYGAGKLQWLLTHTSLPAGTSGRDSVAMGPVAAWLLQHLITGRPPAIDHANAARTLLWSLDRRDWDDWLLDLFAIPRAVLPRCLPVQADYGVTRAGTIPVTAVNGDQCAALYAYGQPAADTLVVNIGTGAFVLLPIGTHCHHHPVLLTGLSRSDARSAEYTLEGTINGAGAALQWAAQQYGLENWDEQLPGWLDTIHSPPVFLNSIGGLGAPWWRPGPAPAYVAPDGIIEPEPADALVAVTESIVFLIQANIELLCELYPQIARIRVSGGLSILDGLCQRLASLSGLRVERPQTLEATARGIAWLAAGCPNHWQAVPTERQFTPVDDPGLRQRYARFRKLLEAS